MTCRLRVVYVWSVYKKSTMGPGVTLSWLGPWVLTTPEGRRVFLSVWIHIKFVSIIHTRELPYVMGRFCVGSEPDFPLGLDVIY